ncbi:MAG: S9 family peptidase, partial [Alphaproteobacteria bacterium]
MRKALTWAVLAAALTLSGTTVMAQAPSPADPYAYLDEIEGTKALDFARAENARSLPVLEGDRRYKTYYDQALAIATATDRIPAVSFAGASALRNFWQDQEHVRGIWRETTRESYAGAQVAWRTLLDLDAVAKAENRNWVWKDVSCLPPDQTLCLVELSDGGKDAVTVREFNARTGQFVAGGFVSPEAKQDVAWLDADTVLIGTDWGAGSMTTSGYPYIVKQWKRGTPLASAQEIFRGKPEDVATSAAVLRDQAGKVAAVMMERSVSFFETQHLLQVGDGVFRPLNLPAKSTLQGLVDDELIFTLEEDW